MVINDNPPVNAVSPYNNWQYYPQRGQYGYGSTTTVKTTTTKEYDEDGKVTKEVTVTEETTYANPNYWTYPVYTYST